MTSLRALIDDKMGTFVETAPSTAVRREDVVARGANGRRIPLRIYRPVKGGERLPCLYWMHGGGYVAGSHTMDDSRFERWTAQLNVVGVSVGYRLAPEHPYPAALDDAYDGLRWLHVHAAELGIEQARIGVGGASAGAGLAAGLSLLSRDREDEPSVAFQVLLYPMLDDRLVMPSSGWDAPVISPALSRLQWRAYLGALAEEDVPSYAAPARAHDLGGLPPALVVVGALDRFVDEDVDYALRLNRAGVGVELHVFDGSPHGFDAMARTSALVARATLIVDDGIRALLHGSQARP